MSLLSGLKSLFTPSEKKPEAFPAEEYKGFTITPTPSMDGSQYRVCGIISKDDKEHQFFRADSLGSAEGCATETMRKAKMTIDQLGDSIFR